jgi:biotin-(acetyl-CoA carboxylase) ligase
MENLYTTSRKGASLFPQWRDNLVTLGKAVRAHNGDEAFEGIAETVEEDGSLVIKQASGARRRFTVGDVTLRE